MGGKYIANAVHIHHNWTQQAVMDILRPVCQESEYVLLFCPVILKEQTFFFLLPSLVSHKATFTHAVKHSGLSVNSWERAVANHSSPEHISRSYTLPHVVISLQAGIHVKNGMCDSTELCSTPDLSLHFGLCLFLCSRTTATTGRRQRDQHSTKRATHSQRTKPSDCQRAK